MSAVSSSPESVARAEKARRLRLVADQVERGDVLSPVVAELADRLAAEASDEDEKMSKIIRGIADRHGKILDALAK